MPTESATNGSGWFGGWKSGQKRDHWLPGGGCATALLVLLTAAARARGVAAGGWDGSPRRMARSVVPGTASWILVRHVLSRFSVQTCANRNECHPVPVSYGSVLQPLLPALCDFRPTPSA